MVSDQLIRAPSGPMGLPRVRSHPSTGSQLHRLVRVLVLEELYQGVRLIRILSALRVGVI